MRVAVTVKKIAATVELFMLILILMLSYLRILHFSRKELIIFQRVWTALIQYYSTETISKFVRLPRYLSTEQWGKPFSGQLVRPLKMLQAKLEKYALLQYSLAYAPVLCHLLVVSMQFPVQRRSFKGYWPKYVREDMSRRLMLRHDITLLWS